MKKELERWLEQPWAPVLLVASPLLQDPYFARSVVFLTTHTEEGAFGLVVNRDLEIRLGDICRELKIPYEEAADRQAVVGGPVEPNHLWIIHEEGRQFKDTETILEGVAVSASLDALTYFASEPEPAAKLVLGHAGWGAGQLEREFAEGAWFLAPVQPELIFEPQLDSIWHRALASIGLDSTHLLPPSFSVH